MLVSTRDDFTGLDPLGDLAGGEPSTQTLLGRQLQTWETVTTPLGIR